MPLSRDFCTYQSLFKPSVELFSVLQIAASTPARGRTRALKGTGTSSSTETMATETKKETTKEEKRLVTCIGIIKEAMDS